MLISLSSFPSIGLLMTQSTNVSSYLGSSTCIPIVQSASTSAQPATTGVIFTSLDTSIHPTERPVAVASVSNVIPRLFPSPLSQSFTITISTSTHLIPDANILASAATPSPLSQFPYKNYHPQEGVGIKAAPGKPKQTNKFYSNWYLNQQKSTVFTFPYSISFTGSGMAVAHTERSQLAFAPGTPPQYFINPLYIESIILSATSLANGANLTLDSLEHASVRVSLSPPKSSIPSVIFPVVQGQAFVTALYSGAQPLIKSQVFFKNLTYAGPTSFTSTYKYRATLEDSTHWMIYLTPNNPSAPAPLLTLHNSGMILGPAAYSGSIQISKTPDSVSAPAINSEAIYDQSAGAYPTNMTIAASVSGTMGIYSMSWFPSGITNRYLLMYLLPHHIESLDPAMVHQVQKVSLSTPTKGIATAFLGDFVTLLEPYLPTTTGFDPYPIGGKIHAISESTRRIIQNATEFELTQNVAALMQNPISMYWQGKGLARYAMSTYSALAYAKNTSLALYGLAKLKTAFDPFVHNQQAVPLYYDGYWGGIVTSASYTQQDAGLDYGATYYNDHHFHYSYFVYAASVIALLDPSWLQQGSNKAWVDNIIRDYANSASNDAYFPFSRMFDWWHGHSWAAGLFESADGKNEESTSEDSLSLYALKMWGQVSGNANLEARGNLQLAILARSLRNYFLMRADNVNQPAAFIWNKESGIMFENKIDHTTYFGQNIEYIAGIHQLPITAVSPYVRTAQFVREEWTTYFSNGRVNQAEGPWRNILYADLAIVDSVASWTHFANSSFDPAELDSGASWAWYLAFAAALGGAPL